MWSWLYKGRHGKICTFCVPIKKCNDVKTITKRLRFIDSFRFISASLSDIFDNLSGIFISKVCKKCMKRKVKGEYKFDGLEENRLI